jgi:hypothetical protein
MNWRGDEFIAEGVGWIDLFFFGHVYIVAHLGVGFGCRSAERWAHHELKPGEKGVFMYILKPYLVRPRVLSPGAEL